MMKLSAIEKFDRKMLRSMMLAQNGQIFPNANDGITVVVVPACGRTDSEFVQVAVAQCSPGDTFKRKRGELVALERWADGCVLSVRRNGRCLQDVAHDIVDFLTM
jgi:hypothetical protein